jgi:hypothetical protein
MFGQKNSGARELRAGRRAVLIVARSDATTLFDFVKEALDEIAGSVEMRTEADWVVAIGPAIVFAAIGN